MEAKDRPKVVWLATGRTGIPPGSDWSKSQALNHHTIPEEEWKAEDQMVQTPSVSTGEKEETPAKRPVR